MANQPDITLYTAQTPNGIKISIALEELGYVPCLGMPSVTRADCQQTPIQGREDRYQQKHPERAVCTLHSSLYTAIH